VTKRLTVALFSAGIIALSVTSSFAQGTPVHAGSDQNIGPTEKANRQGAVRPLLQGFREQFAAMPTVDGRSDLQIDYARPPAQPAQ
jgi:hypothetical protein